MSDAKDLYPDVFEEIARIRAAGGTAVLVTVISVSGSTPRDPGAKMLVYPDGRISGTVGGGVREADIINAARELAATGGSRLLEVDFTEGLKKGSKGPVCGGVMSVFMEHIGSPRRAVICGAGHVGWHLHRILALMEFRMVIIDPRPELNTADRFPGATRFVRGFDEGLKDLDLTAADAVILIGPGHEEDERMLPHTLRSGAGYLGMIGSKRKVKEVFARMREQGFSDDDLARVHSPVGLPIGSESPAEIAVSIAAEILRYFRIDAVPSA